MTRPADGGELRGRTQIVEPEWALEQRARDTMAWIGEDGWLRPEPDRWPLGIRALVIVALGAVLWCAILLAWAALA